MSDKLKLTIGIIAGIVSAILLFCLIVVIGCSVNGLTFGEQVCQWFGGSSSTAETADEVVEAIANNLTA